MNHLHLGCQIQNVSIPQTTLRMHEKIAPSHISVSQANTCVSHLQCDFLKIFYIENRVVRFLVVFRGHTPVVAH